MADLHVEGRTTDCTFDPRFKAGFCKPCTRVLCGLQVSVQDGLAAVAAAEAGRYNAIVVDAGSGDAAASMSCPPPAFLTPEFLQQVRPDTKPLLGGPPPVNVMSLPPSPERHC